jgi:hypothetical protein
MPQGKNDRSPDGGDVQDGSTNRMILHNPLGCFFAFSVALLNHLRVLKNESSGPLSISILTTQDIFLNCVTRGQGQIVLSEYEQEYSVDDDTITVMYFY